MSSSHDEAVWVETQNSAEFKELRKKFRNFAFPVTAAFLGWYFLYVLLTAFARDWVERMREDMMTAFWAAIQSPKSASKAFLRAARRSRRRRLCE